MPENDLIVPGTHGFQPATDHYIGELSAAEPGAGSVDRLRDALSALASRDLEQAAERLRKLLRGIATLPCPATTSAACLTLAAIGLARRAAGPIPDADAQRAAAQATEGLLARALETTEDPRVAVNASALLLQHALTLGDLDRVQARVTATRRNATRPGNEAVLSYFEATADYAEAELAFRQARFDDARGPAERSGNAFRELQAADEFARAQALLGAVLALADDPDRALTPLRFAVDYFERAQDRERLAFALQNVGIAELKKGAPDAAADALRRSAKYFERTGIRKASRSRDSCFSGWSPATERGCSSGAGRRR